MKTNGFDAAIMSPDPVEPRRSHLARNAGIVSLAVMASRLLGLVRDQVFAAFFGAGLEYDAFLTAFRVPNLLRDLLAEGALSAAFVTTFSRVLEEKGRKEAMQLSDRVATAIIVVISAISVAGWFGAPAVVYLLAPGFFEVPGKANLTIHLTRIMIPFLLLVALAAQAMGILNAHRRFGMPALASAFFNLGSILGGLLLGFWIGPYLGLAPIEGMAYGTLIGGFLQFAVQWPSLARIGFRYRPALDFADPGMRQILGLMGPAIIGNAAVQINVFVNTHFASAIIDPMTGVVANGPVSWLNYAFRFMHLPIGVFGVAVATAAIPQLSRSAARNDLNEFRATLTHSLSLVFLLCIPAAAGLAVLGGPIIGLIFEHGRFTTIDTIQTAHALAAYSAGLAGYAALKVISPAFYALNDARTPMVVALVSIAVNYVLNSVLVGPFGHLGLAFATSAVALVNFALLILLMRRRLGGLDGRRLGRTVLKICLASAVMAAAAWSLSSAIRFYFAAGGTILYSAQVTGAIALAGVVFYFACRALRIEELSEAMNTFMQPLFRRLGWK